MVFALPNTLSKWHTFGFDPNSVPTHDMRMADPLIIFVCPLVCTWHENVWPFICFKNGCCAKNRHGWKQRSLATPERMSCVVLSTLCGVCGSTLMDNQQSLKWIFVPNYTYTPWRPKHVIKDKHTFPHEYIAIHFERQKLEREAGHECACD